MVTHANVTRLISSARQRLEVGRDDVWTMFHSLAFDFSVWEIWGALITGGRLVVVPRLVSRDTDTFYGLVRDAGVTVLSQTPSAFRQFEAVDSAVRGPLSLRAVVFGGEALDQASVRRWASRRGYGQPRLINMYGITETTVHVTFEELDDGKLGRALTQLGIPLPGVRVHVLDDRGELCPVGVPGEMFVGGSGVTRGYLGRPELTAGRFVPDHLGGEPGGRLYRSGDLARWNSGGGLEYVGRSDNQVKVRGYRIELGEVESALATHPGVAECVVVAHDDGGQTDLTAYLVPRGTAPSTSELRSWLGRLLPAYMIPRAFAVIGALPLTPQGKIDRHALRPAGGIRPDLAQEYVAPLPGVEETLAEVWGRVLAVDRVGRHDNFFDLGGDSIRSIQVLGQAQAAGIQVALQDLFRFPTLAELAGATSRHQGPRQARPALEPFELVAPEDTERLPAGLVDAYPMAELQVGMVYEMERNRSRSAYHNVDSLRIAGPFDEAKFSEAVALVVERHPNLRTSFDPSSYREPLQLVHATAQMPILVTDLRGLDSELQESAIAEYVAAERARLFDQAKPPLLRFAIHLLSDRLFQWTITEHHAILDGWSLHSTFSEIGANYESLLAGRTAGRKPPASAYRDFIVAERGAIESAESESFWLGKVSDRPDCRLPSWPAGSVARLASEPGPDEWRLRSETAGYGSVETLLPEDVCDGLVALARRCGVPVKSVALAAHLRVLSLVTGSPDLLTGLTANGRLEEEDGAEVRGLFLNTVPLRLRLPEGSWLDLITATFDAERELLPHRRYPLGALQRKLGGGALFEANFVYNHFHVMGAAFGAEHLEIIDDKIQSFSTMRVEPTNFPLSVGVLRSPFSNRLLLAVDYHTDVLTDDQAVLLRGYYLRVFEAMTTDPQAPHYLAQLRGEAERALAASWNDTRAEIPPVMVHQLVQARAEEAPDAVAVACGPRSLTYGQLNARANQLAWRLRELGVGPEVVVGVCLERSADLVIALLAVLKAGGLYAALDAEIRADRLGTMLRQAGAPVVLAHDGTAGRLPAGPWQVINLDAEAPAAPAAPAGDLPELATPGNACYVTFTPGRAGQPKGVVTTHRNVTGLLRGGDCLALTPADTLLQLASLSSEVSTFELWAPLAAGARLVLAPASRYTPADIAAWAAEHQVTVLYVGSSSFGLLVEHEPQLFDQLRRLLTAGETVSSRYAAQILARCPQLEIVSCWGPSETTAFSVCGTYTRDTLPEGPLPLGTPLASTGVYVLDHHGRPVPVGTPGELCVSGPCVARGYLGNPALTAGRFTPHPYGPPGSRIYRTGDRGRWSPDGHVEFAGRASSPAGPRPASPTWWPASGRRPSRARPELDQAFVAPEPGVEKLLADLWCRVLDLDQIGRHDSFFDLGVDSIRSIQLLGQARTAGLQLALDDILTNSTLAELAMVVGSVDQAAAPPDPFALVAPGGPGAAAGRAGGRLPDGRAPGRHGVRDGAGPRPAPVPQRDLLAGRGAVRRGEVPRGGGPRRSSPPDPAHLLRPDRLPRAAPADPRRHRGRADRVRRARPGPRRAARRAGRVQSPGAASHLRGERRAVVPDGRARAGR